MVSYADQAYRQSVAGSVCQPFSQFLSPSVRDKPSRQAGLRLSQGNQQRFTRPPKLELAIPLGEAAPSSLHQAAMQRVPWLAEAIYQALSGSEEVNEESFGRWKGRKEKLVSEVRLVVDINWER